MSEQWQGDDDDDTSVHAAGQRGDEEEDDGFGESGREESHWLRVWHEDTNGYYYWNKFTNDVSGSANHTIASALSQFAVRITPSIRLAMPRQHLLPVAGELGPAMIQLQRAVLELYATVEPWALAAPARGGGARGEARANERVVTEYKRQTRSR